MSRGLRLLEATNWASPSGRSLRELEVSMLWRLTAMLSTFWTGDQPWDPRRSRQIMPLE